MDERLFRRLAERLADAPVVLASVIGTRGATPRKHGSRMLIGAQWSEYSVGGGMAESRVIAAARDLFNAAAETHEVQVDLGGGPASAGVCGGQMRIALRRWSGAVDRQRAEDIARRLSSGEPATLPAAWIGADSDETALPDPRLLIVGGGHCAAALCDLAAFLAFDLWVHDTRGDCLQSPSFACATRLSGGFDALLEACKTRRELLVVLLNRDFASDVASLRVLDGQAMSFIGMMGSRKRIHEVRAALPGHEALFARLQAPVGLEIGAHTPHEIAVSLLAQLVQSRSVR